MGLSQILRQLAVRRAHVLIVAGPGHWVTRVNAEQGVLRRGWRLATTPAQADLLAVCGRPGQALSGAVEVLWEQMPGPRVRVDIPDAETVEEALQEATDRLLQWAPYVGDARRRSSREQHTEQGDGRVSSRDQESHGEMEMAPAGIPLAEGGEDRDGLQMDVLHLRLGPVLPHWPAGLVLHCSLQGDVVGAAEARLLDAGSTGPGHCEQVGGRAVLQAAHRCDNVSDVLALAGWQDAAATARGIRDSLVTRADPQGSLLTLDRLHRHVGRSRLLRWSLRGLGPLDDHALRRYELHPTLGGDVHDRLLSLLERARAAAARSPAGADGVNDPDAVLAALPAMVAGLDLAAARLVVASFGLEPLTVTREVRRG